MAIPEQNKIVGHEGRLSNGSSFSDVKLQRRAEGLLLACTLIWGSTFVIMKFALSEVSPLFFVAIRFLIATGILVLIFRSRLLSISRDALIKGGALGILLGLGFATQTIGLNFTTASKSAFVTGTMVIFTPLMQFIIERRFPTVGNIVGVGSVSLGLYFLTSPAGSEFNIGDALTLICAILFAIYIVYLDVISKEIAADHLTFIQIATVGILCALLAVFFEPISFEPTSLFWSSLIYLTLLATLLTTYVQTRHQKYTTPTRAAIIFSLEPVIAAIMAYFILNEIIGTLGVFGGALIVAGLLISELSDFIPILNRKIAKDTA